jgi:hypothetical protein
MPDTFGGSKAVYVSSSSPVAHTQACIYTGRALHIVYEEVHTSRDIASPSAVKRVNVVVPGTGSVMCVRMRLLRNLCAI